ncbi:helix-turn-helix domain-containing protein [Sporomusa termitida]|uniref:Cytoskeleton protein RodZ n=1 Tax=Sporomusa termitida TaxID=2377 RepID=A0A517DTA1_9FIRM|nr:helix-turn-helix domain-containing protein [Sporomusa termitida]QDR80577.1 Cytoskeleton protein RodZ [Sporomusa termitida]
MQTVGEILRAERVKKGLTIKDIENAISIRALYIEAIEEGNYGIIPGEVYLKGFIRNYATFLGLDSQQIMEVYRQNKELADAKAPAAQPEETAAAPPAAAGGGLTKWLAIAIVAAGVVAGIAWWSAGSKNAEPSQKQREQAAQQQLPAPPAAPLQAAQTAKPASKVVITATYNGQCWTQIIADGKEIYEGIPKKGESFTWEAANRLTAKFGNAGAVDLVYNGSVVGKIGENGEVVAKTFTLSDITQ